MNPLVTYYLHQAGRGSKPGSSSVGPIYYNPPFVQKGHGIGSFLGGVFRFLKPILWTSAKAVGRETMRNIGKEAMRTGSRMLSDIADNTSSDITARDIMTRHLSALPQNILSNLRGSGKKRKRSVSASPRKRKRAKVTPRRKGKRRAKSKRAKRKPRRRRTCKRKPVTKKRKHPQKKRTTRKGKKRGARKTKKTRGVSTQDVPTKRDIFSE